MEFSNSGSSTYHRFIAHFVRDGTSLLRVSGPRSSELSTAWSHIRTQLSAPTETRGLRCHNVQIPSQTSLTLFEKKVDGRYCGVAVTSDDSYAEIDAFMSTIIIKQARLVFDTIPSIVTPEVEALTVEITDMFNSTLKYAAPGDMWDAQGREVFLARIQYFVSRGLPIELVLPAFPCKSSNTDKVASQKPDRGEELALLRLHRFVAELESLYQPGGKMWVVSDGHVFSDCIGVDDDEVDTYTAQLIDMNDQIAESTNGQHRIGFIGLVDVFDLDASPAGIEELHSSLSLPALDHHVATGITPEAESCRQILMAGSACLPSGVRARIDSKDPSILALYRGFSRFMLEDLDLNKATKHLSKSKKRKVSSKVAFEMILRNQGYSNLVEIVFPNHVRLSIHAHRNSGPKFGIQLFDPSTMRTTDSLEDLTSGGMETCDLLHIPTPWHNSVVEIDGSNIIFVTKSKLARDAMASGHFDGAYENGAGAVGSSFCLVPKTEKKEEKAGITSLPTPPPSPPTNALRPLPAPYSPPTIVIPASAPVAVMPAQNTTAVKPIRKGSVIKIQIPNTTVIAAKTTTPVTKTPIRRPTIFCGPGAYPQTPSSAAAVHMMSPIIQRRGTLFELDQEVVGEMGDKTLMLLGTLADSVVEVVKAQAKVWGTVTRRAFAS